MSPHNIVIIPVVVFLFFYFFREMIPYHLHIWEMQTPSKRKCKKCGKKQNRVCYPWISKNVYWENDK